MNSILMAIFRAIVAFFTGKLFGSKSASHKQAEKTIESYREGEKIDAQADIDNDGLRSFFDRVRK